MSLKFQAVVNLENDLAYYNMLIANYNVTLVEIRNLLIKLNNHPTDEQMADLYNKLSKSQEDNLFLLKEIENESTKLINDMKTLNKELRNNS